MRGADKLLEPIDGVPILQRLATSAVAVAPTFVTLPSLTHTRRSCLPESAHSIAVPNADRGMAFSLRAGIQALPETATGVIILPADMPDITQNDLAQIHGLAQSDSPTLLRATTDDGKPGHPIYFARHLFAQFDQLSGDRGAFEICQNHAAETTFFPLNGQRARLDLDTPEDWDSYRKTLKP